MSFLEKWVLWPGLLVRQEWRLYSIVGQDCRFASLSGQGHSIGSTASMACLVTQIRYNCQPSSVARWSHWLSPEDGQEPLAGSMLQCLCKHKGGFPQSQDWLLYAPLLAPSLSDPCWSSPAGFPSDLYEVKSDWAFQETSCNTEVARCPPWALFFHGKRETVDPGSALGAALCQPAGGVMWSESSPSSYPSNVVLFGLCGSLGGFSLTPVFWGSHSGILFMGSC